LCGTSRLREVSVNAAYFAGIAAIVTGGRTASTPASVAQKLFRRSAMSDYGQPLFPKLRYCTRCCMPETNEGMQFDTMGICLACRSSEQKMHIDWTQREKMLREVLEHFRDRSGDNYDCIVPISGGKDSWFQMHVITKVYGMRPLTVTASHNWYSPAGKRNLDRCIEIFGVDHMLFTPSRQTVNKMARASLTAIGDSCWHCHTGVSAFPQKIALNFGIPLLIYGESPAEFSGRATYLNDDAYEATESGFVSDRRGRDNIFRSDPEHWLKNSAKVPAEEMVGHAGLTAKDLAMYRMPDPAELVEAGITAIFLGDYMFWDHERQTEFLVKEYGWEEDDVEGTYKRYKSVECIMPGVHDYTKFLKRGFGRGTDMASQDVRAGLLTREEGFELAKRYDTKRPGALDYYLDITGYSEDEFRRIMAQKRVARLADEESSEDPTE
jgi:N-acetyl sugar amidotransferase